MYWEQDLPRARGRSFRATIPNAPKHAVVLIFNMGMAGFAWEDVVEALDAWRFRTSRLRRWTVVSTRQCWHQLALPDMKATRAQNLKPARAARPAYLDELRRMTAWRNERSADAVQRR